MAPMVGKELTEKYFLSQFDNLCSDPLFHVRKVSYLLGVSLVAYILTFTPFAVH